MNGHAPPAGFVRVSVGRCVAVVASELERDARALLSEGTLYEAAARDAAARPLMGRGVAYSIALPISGGRVVVRHNRHGGLFASLTRDLFLPPTRAPYELAAASRLSALGLRTPAVVMYCIEPGPFPFQRADVVTTAIVGGRDLSSFLAPECPASDRSSAWSATRALVRTMNALGVRHHDLNVKNVLIAPGDEARVAWLLDVDRVTFHEAGSADVARGNVRRLLRSSRKWRAERGAVVDERELELLTSEGDAAR